MGGTVDLYDVKVVDGYVLRCDIVRDLNRRLNSVYEFYDVAPLFCIGSDVLTELRENCLDVIRIMTYLCNLSLLSGNLLGFESKRLQNIVNEIAEILERREET